LLKLPGGFASRAPDAAASRQPIKASMARRIALGSEGQAAAIFAKSWLQVQAVVQAGNVVDASRASARVAFGVALFCKLGVGGSIPLVSTFLTLT
jgi:hypothetical protein